MEANEEVKPEAEWDAVAKMSVCGWLWRKWEHLCGAGIRVPYHCHVSLCERCAEHRRDDIVSKYVPAISQWSGLSLLTFTVPDAHIQTPTQVVETWDSLVSEFSALRRTKLWDDKTPGLVCREFTLKAGGGFHPHLHALTPIKDRSKLDALAHEWKKRTGGILDFKTFTIAAGGHVGEELAKNQIRYLAKRLPIRHMDPQTILDVVEAIKGVNRCWAIGGLKPSPLLDDGTIPVCPKCETPFCPRPPKEGQDAAWKSKTYPRVDNFLARYGIHGVGGSADDFFTKNGGYTEFKRVKVNNPDASTCVPIGKPSASPAAPEDPNAWYFARCKYAADWEARHGCYVCAIRHGYAYDGECAHMPPASLAFPIPWPREEAERSGAPGAPLAEDLGALVRPGVSA